MVAMWHSLYLHCNDRAVILKTLHESLTTLGYTHYDPFGGLPGKAYQRTVKLFIAPERDGWTRLIGSPDAQQPALLSTLGVCIDAAFDVQNATISTYVDGQSVDMPSALTPFLRPERTAHDLTTALTLSTIHTSEDGDVPMSALPDDVQQMAQGLNTKSINRLFGKMMKRVNKQVGDSQAEDARKLLNAGVDWQSSGAAKMRTFMHCLMLPENWHTPEFTALRDAYQLHQRRQRNPNAMLYPGDADAMAAVPDALDYVPVYGGQ